MDAYNKTTLQRTAKGTVSVYCRIPKVTAPPKVTPPRKKRYFFFAFLLNLESNDPPPLLPERSDPPGSSGPFQKMTIQTQKMY